MVGAGLVDMGIKTSLCRCSQLRKPHQSDLQCDLCTCNEDCPIHAPGEGKDFSSHIKLSSACLASDVPESNSAVACAACKLKFPSWTECNLLNGMSVTFKLNLALRDCSVWIPDANRAIGGPSRYQRTSSIP